MVNIEQNERTRELCLYTLARHVMEDCPRLFAIYGVLRGDDTRVDLICGWGMEWHHDLGGAIFYDPDSRTTWRSDSAEKLLARYQRVAEARLVWLDEGTNEA
jgi:hypothetical protein